MSLKLHNTVKSILKSISLIIDKQIKKCVKKGLLFQETFYYNKLFNYSSYAMYLSVFIV